MKNLTLLLLLSLLPFSGWAQDTRTIPVKILDKKGRPVKNVALESVSADRKGITDATGMYVFKDMPDSDTLSVKLPKFGKTVIPVAGMDSIVIHLYSASRYKYVDRERLPVTVEKDNAKSNTVLDVPEILKKQSYTSLIDLLRGRVAGLNFTPSATGESSASLRGVSSMASNNEPLVALDGTLVGTVSEVNTFINIHDIKTIEILKTASEWGVRGSNGVIVITTIRN